MRKFLYRLATRNRPTTPRKANFLPVIQTLEDRSVPATFTFAGVTFDDTKTPDAVSLLPVGVYSGAHVTSLPTSAIQAPVAFPDQPAPGFNTNSTLGTLLFGGNGSRALNLPSGNVGVTERSGIELAYTGARAIVNTPGNDFIDYESASNVNVGTREPEPVMVQAYIVNTGSWTKWYYNEASSVSHYTGDPTQGAFATQFDLSNMGVPDGFIVSKVRLVNVTASDRTESNTGVGFIIPEDKGGSTNLPNPGPLSDFPTYGPNTLDPDPIYFASFGAVVSNAANVKITVTSNPNPAPAGGLVTYTITVTNTGPATASGVPLTFNPPAGLLNVTYTSNNDGSASGNTPTGSNSINDTLNLPGNSTIIYTVMGTISPNQVGPLPITVTAGPPNAPVVDVNPGDSTVVYNTPVANSGDVAVSFTSTPATAGQTETYTVTYVNNGPSGLNSVAISNTVSNQLTGVTFTSVASNGANGNTTSGFGSPSESINLPVSGKVVYTITGQIPANASGQVPFNTTIMVDANSTDPDLSNNSASEDQTITQSGDLGVTITSNSPTVIQGGTIVYTITATNTGPTTATSSLVSDIFSSAFSGVTFTSTASGGASGNSSSGTGDLNQNLTLPANSMVVYTVTGQLAPGATGPLTSNVHISGPANFVDNNAANNSASNTVMIVPAANISVTVSANPTPAPLGGLVTYTVTVTNSGPSGATGVPLTFTPPPGLTGVTFTSSNNGGASGNTPSGSNSINDTLALPANGVVVYTVTGTVSTTAGNPLVTTFTAGQPASPVVDPNPNDNTNTFSQPTQSQGDLQVTIVPGPAYAGASTTYTITVKNAGPSPLTGVPFTSASPVGLTGVSFTSTPSNGATGSTNGTGGINNTLNLPSGGFVTYTVTGNVPANATGNVTVTATATPPSGSIDPTPGDATATTTTPITKSSDLAVTITSNGQTTAVTGTKVTYTITATNKGPSPVTGANFSDIFTAAYSGVTFTSTAAGGAAGNTTSGSGSLGDSLTLPPGATVTYTVQATITPGYTGTLTNSPAIMAPAGVSDPSPNNNTASNTINVIPGANVGITVTPSSPTAPNGGVLTYTVTVTNTGPSAASGVSVSSVLPAGLSGVTYTSTSAGGASGNRSAGTGNLSDSLTLPSGGQVIYIVKGRVGVGISGDLSSTFSAANPAGLADPDPSNNSVTVTTPIRPSPKVIYAASTGTSVVTQVFVYNTDGSQRFSYQPYDNRFTRGVNVAIGDINGDGFPDVVTGAAAGGGSHVRAVNGNNGADLFSFFGYGSTVRTGVNVAVGDVTGDGVDDIITGSDTGGGPRVRVFDLSKGGRTGTSVLDFFAFDSNIRTGVRVAVGDVDGDGVKEIICSEGAAFNGLGGSSEVRIFNGKTGKLITSFTSFEPTSTRGVYVTAADLDGDKKAEIIVGNGTSSTLGGPAQPLVRIFSPANNNQQIREFYAYETGFRGGVRVATFADDSTDIVNPPTRLIVGPGPGGGPRLRQFDILGNDRGSQYLIKPDFRGGLYVG